MNEALSIEFWSQGKMLNLIDANEDMGLTFDTHPGASPLLVGLGFRPVLPALLTPLRERRDWRNGEFKLKHSVENGRLKLDGKTTPKDCLPAPTI